MAIRLFYKTRFRLIFTFVSVAALVGLLSLAVGSRLIRQTVFAEATNRIRQDLNAAREIYQNQENLIRVALMMLAADESFKESITMTDGGSISGRLRDTARSISLDFAGLYSSRDSLVFGIDETGMERPASGDINPAVGMALLRQVPISGTLLLPREALFDESPKLAEQAYIEVLPTPMAEPSGKTEETSGLVIIAAVPVFSQGDFLGVVYGGILLNRSTEIVDLVRDTVFQGEMYGGRIIGTATVFQNDLRISTNVFAAGGNRAIGTRVSKEVKDAVLERGEPWVGRAFVVDDWFITAYEPIVDIVGERIGMLYVGVLEAKYTDIRWSTLRIFIVISLAGILVAVFLGYLFGKKIYSPVSELIEISKKVSQGDFSPNFGPPANSEIGVLQKTFREMVAAIRKRDEQRLLDSEIKLQQSERQASVGRLAAGVAHEINNPLTGVLTFTHMLLQRKDLNREVRGDLETIAEATERVRTIVKGLLDFSRQTDIEPVPTDVNDLIAKSINLIENQALVKGVILCFDPSPNIPMKTIDRSQIESVLINMYINAIDSCEKGGHITITTSLGISPVNYQQKGIDIVIQDTGCGIEPESLNKIFDPFYTTKEVGKGTGLGLSVSYGIIQRHGGMISVKSKVNLGTTFTVWLPLDKESS